MDEFQKYVAKVQNDFNSGRITLETAQRQIILAGELSDSRGNFGAGDRAALRYGDKKIVPIAPPPGGSDPEPPPGGGGGPTPTPIFRAPRILQPQPEPPPPVPVVPQPPPAPEITRGIKQATPDIIIFDEESIDPGFLVEAFFEEFGGTELINISRTDLINGDRVSYSPIVNLSEIYRKYNPNNIISISQYQELPTKYGIDLVSRGPKEPYFDENGDMVIEIDIVKNDESIEVEFALNGTISRIEQ